MELFQKLCAEEMFCNINRANVRHPVIFFILLFFILSDMATILMPEAICF